MEFNLRLSSNRRASYPLPLHGSPTWERCDGAWVFTSTVPRIPKDHIIVPSFAMRDCDYSYQFSIAADTEPERRSELMWVPPRISATTSAAEKYFSTHIDCWHTTRATAATITLRVESEAQPLDDLISISIRPLRLKKISDQAAAASVVPPIPLSQMMAPSNIARGICSPTALAMAINSCWPHAIRACYDPNTRAYGCWPLAIHHAACNGVLGAVEVLSRWQEVVTILRAGRPIVCSINFSNGQLADAPLPQTSGHLVVLYGIEEGFALVMDPAAPSHATVPRRYAIGEFSQSWLHQRGAAYIFGD